MNTNKVPPEVRWELAKDLFNFGFNFYMAGQASMGRSTEEAYANLKKVWDREDREHLEVARRIAQVLSRAGRPSQ